MVNLNDSLIVIIDDNTINNYICEKIIQEYSSLIKIESHSISEDGINVINNYKSKISLLFLDLSMPVYDGWEILEIIASKNIQIPTIILTSSLNPEDLDKSKKYSFVKEFLIKPISFLKMESILNEVFA